MAHLYCKATERVSLEYTYDHYVTDNWHMGLFYVTYVPHFYMFCGSNVTLFFLYEPRYFVYLSSFLSFLKIIFIILWHIGDG